LDNVYKSILAKKIIETTSLGEDLEERGLCAGTLAVIASCDKFAGSGRKKADRGQKREGRKKGSTQTRRTSSFTALTSAETVRTPKRLTCTNYSIPRSL
jgi:hypothetical protein